MANITTIVTVAVTATAAIIGLLWIFGRKKTPPAKRRVEPPDRPPNNDAKEPENASVKTSTQMPVKEVKSDVSNGKLVTVLDSSSGRVSSEYTEGSIQCHGDQAADKSKPCSKNDKVLVSGSGDTSISSEPDIVSEVSQEDIVTPTFSKPCDTATSLNNQWNKSVSESELKDTVAENLAELEEETIAPTQVQVEDRAPMLSSPKLEPTRTEPVSQNSEVSEHIASSDYNNVPEMRNFENENSDDSLEIDTVVVANSIDADSNKLTEDWSVNSSSDLTESAAVDPIQNGDSYNPDLQERHQKDSNSVHANSSSVSKEVDVIDLTNDDSVIDLTVDDHLNSRTENLSNESKPEKQSESMGMRADNHPEVHPENNNNHSDSSSNCDNLSEASNDSGKGGSVHDNAGMSPPDEDRIFEFNIPSDLCGLFIGTRGKTIKMISQQSGTKIRLQNNPYMRDYQICVIEGSRVGIDTACKIIKKRFPAVQFPGIEPLPPNPVIMPEIMQLSLPEGVSVDIVVSSIVDAGRVFVQQPTHPTFPSLDRLNTFMSQCYMQEGAVPDIPRPIESGVICSAPMLNGWYRAQIMASHEETGECDIKYVDYGGYARISSSLLKQIRSDFMTLPFEAVECYLANITPLENEQYFSAEAAVVLEELTQGKLLQGQVVGRAEDGIPYIHVYQICGANSALLVNREMVNRGVVRWMEVME